MIKSRMLPDSGVQTANCMHLSKPEVGSFLYPESTIYLSRINSPIISNTLFGVIMVCKNCLGDEGTRY